MGRATSKGILGGGGNSWTGAALGGKNTRFRREFCQMGIL